MLLRVGCPTIWNRDQGSHFTSSQYTWAEGRATGPGAQQERNHLLVYTMPTRDKASDLDAQASRGVTPCLRDGHSNHDSAWNGGYPWEARTTTLCWPTWCVCSVMVMPCRLSTKSSGDARAVSIILIHLFS